MKPIFPLLLLSFFHFSCGDEVEKDNQVQDSPDGVYADYQVWAEEGSSDVTIRLQYRRGTNEGEAFAVQGPGKVLLDGVELVADSNRFLGTYYEVFKQAESFGGEHHVLFIDEKGNKHRETFMFEPFTLVDEIPERVKKRPFQLHLQNFPESETPVRLVMVDTSLYSDGVNEEIRVEEGVVQISDNNLSNLTKGPVTLEIYREEERPINSGSNTAGKFMMTYGLRRQFLLVD